MTGGGAPLIGLPPQQLHSHHATARKDFAILQSEPKMQQVFGKNVEVSLPKSYHSADTSKGKVLVFKGVSSNIILGNFKELLDFSKINHAGGGKNEIQKIR